MKKSAENLIEYEDRLAKMTDKQLLTEVKSFRHSTKPPLVDMAILEICLIMFPLPKGQRNNLNTIQVWEPMRYSYEKVKNG